MLWSMSIKGIGNGSFRSLLDREYLRSVPPPVPDAVSAMCKREDCHLEEAKVTSHCGKWLTKRRERLLTMKSISERSTNNNKTPFVMPELPWVWKNGGPHESLLVSRTVEK